MATNSYIEVQQGHQVVQSIISSVFVFSAIVLLFYGDLLYSIGKYSTLSLTCVFIIAEYIKWTFSFNYFRYVSSQNEKFGRTSSKKSVGFKPKLKSLLVILSSVIIFYIIAVLFGAPLTSQQEETVMFAIHVTTLTILPCCIQLGADVTIAITTDLIILPDTDSLLNENFKQIVATTIFGAWLGAIVIPLDWDRPWQVWPIPCCMGAIVGNGLSHLFMLIKSLTPVARIFNIRKTGKYGL